MTDEITSDRICAVCGCDATFDWEYQEDGRVRHEWLTICIAALRKKNKQLCSLLEEADDAIDSHAPLCALCDGYGDPCSCDYPDLHKRIKAALDAAGE